MCQDCERTLGYLYKYVNEHTIDIDKIPKSEKIKALEHIGHKIIGDYVYGVKLVSKEYQDMFEVNTYKVGTIVKFDDSDEEFSKFNYVCHPIMVNAHTAGLWSCGCFPNSIKLDPTVTLCVPILVRYPIDEVISTPSDLKGRIIECVSINEKDTAMYIKHK